MRILFALVALAGAMLGSLPAQAQSFETSTELLQYLYDGYAQDRYPLNEPLFSQSLEALFEADRERTPEGEMGALDFDPFSASQDPYIENLRIGEPVGEGGRVVQDVTFFNGGTDITLIYDLVQEKDGWKIDDVAMEPHDDWEGWRLSEILAGDPALN